MLERIRANEWRDMIIAWLVIALAFVPVFNRYGWFNIEGVIASFSLSLIAVGIGFIVHEFSHKFVAIREGFWAEFKRNDIMLILALVMAFVVGIVIAAPGAVMVYGGVSTRQNGKIALAGPLSNIILCAAFLGIFALGGAAAILGAYGARVNAVLALFNMIPFGPLDGKKVWSYDKVKFAGIVVLALAGMGVSMMVISI